MSNTPFWNSFYYRYDVVVVMSSSWTTVTSDVFPLVVQRAVKLNKLLHPASVLLNQTMTVSCRVNAGTEVTFLWSFGDKSSRMGQSIEQHIYHRWVSPSKWLWGSSEEFPVCVNLNTPVNEEVSLISLLILKKCFIPCKKKLTEALKWASH